MREPCGACGPAVLAVLLLLGPACAEMTHSATTVADRALASARIEAQRSGSAIVAQAYLRADLLRANTMQDIERNRRSLETTIGRLAGAVEQISRCTRAQLDATTIDLQQLVPGLNPWSDDRFNLRQINGAQLIEKSSGAYDIAVVGMGVGGFADLPSSSTRWSVEGVAIPATPVAAHEVVLHVPHDALHFAEDELRC